MATVERLVPAAADGPITPLTYSVTETARLLGISRAYAYRLIGQGELPARRVGGRWVVPRAALARYLGEPASP